MTERPDINCAASLAPDGTSAVLLVSKFKGEQLQLPVRLENLPRSGRVKVRKLLIDDAHELAQQEVLLVEDGFELTLNPNTVWLIRIESPTQP